MALPFPAVTDIKAVLQLEPVFRTFLVQVSGSERDKCMHLEEAIN